MTENKNKLNIHKIEIQLQLHINQVLYDKGYITEQMFVTAQKELLTA